MNAETYRIYESYESLDGGSGFEGEWLPKVYASADAAVAAWKEDWPDECHVGHSQEPGGHEHHIIAQVFEVPVAIEFDGLSDDERRNLKPVGYAGPCIP